ncbi:MAG: peptidoglycan DD-metalloendopeptidase family protein [Caulobacteraceae bacterium]
MLRRATLSLCLLVLTAAAPASAPPPALAELQGARRDRDQEKVTPTGQAALVAREVDALRQELVKLGKAEAGGDRAAASQRARLTLLNTREDELRARIGTNRTSLVRLLAALQAYQRRPPPALLVSPRSAKDAVRAAILIRAITPELQARGRRLSAEAEAIREVRREAASASELLFQAESDKADRQVKVQALLAEKRSLERNLYPDGADEAAHAVAARASSMGELVQGLPGRGSEEAAAGPPTRLSAPVQGIVQGRFGQRSPGRVRIEGWTYRTGPEAVVLSPADARIEYSGPLKGWGLVVILRLSSDYRLVLAGMQSADAGVGRPVAVGEPIGRMAAGNTAQELYLEVRKDSTPVDPARWLGAGASG